MQPVPVFGTYAPTLSCCYCLGRVENDEDEIARSIEFFDWDVLQLRFEEEAEDPEDGPKRSLLMSKAPWVDIVEDGLCTSDCVIQVHTGFAAYGWP